MNKYTIYCNPSQTRKALELGAPIKLFCKDYMHGHINYMGNPIPIGHVLIHNDLYYAPTAEQMIGWLEEHISYIDIIKQENNTWLYIFYTDNNSNKNTTVKGFSSRPEATIAAIDAALEYLENQIQ